MIFPIFKAHLKRHNKETLPICTCLFILSLIGRDNQDCWEITEYLKQQATNSVPGKLNNEAAMHKVIMGDIYKFNEMFTMLENITRPDGADFFWNCLFNETMNYTV